MLQDSKIPEKEEPRERLCPSPAAPALLVGPPDRQLPLAEDFWLARVEGPAPLERFCPSQATSDGCVGQEVIFDGQRAGGCGARRRAGCEHGLPGPAAPNQPRAAGRAHGAGAVPDYPLRLLPAGAGECAPQVGRA